MKRQALSLLLAGLLLAPATLRAQPALPAAEAWIQVELLVFRNLGPASATDEQWPARPVLGYPPRLEFLTEPALSATSPAPGAPVPEPLAVTPAAAVPFALLDSGQRGLRDAAARIESSTNYRLLTYAAWRQPAPSPGATDNVVVNGGAVHGEHRELEGYVALTRANFMHVQTHLWLNEFAAAGDPAAASPGAETAGVALPPLPAAPLASAPEPPPVPGDIGAPQPVEATTASDSGTSAAAGEDISVEPARATRSVVLKAQRRVAPGEVHYIDHPLFGAIMTIEPWDPDAATPAPSPAPVSPPTPAP